MLKFICFGSGSSGNCYGLFTENEGLIIDLGIGIRTLKKYFQQYGLSTGNVKYVLLTHDHADHVKSVGSFSHDFSVPVYATREVHHGINGNYCVRHKIDKASVRYIEKNVTFQLGDFQITPFHVPHDSSDNVGYHILAHNIHFCLITDAGHVTDEMKKYVSMANYLVIEANHDEEMLSNGHYPPHLKTRISGEEGHLSNRNCGMVIAENATPELRHVWLCHLSEENNHPELARITVEQILRNHGILPGVDFEVETLKRKSPTGMIELV